MGGNLSSQVVTGQPTSIGFCTPTIFFGELSFTSTGVGVMEGWGGLGG